MIRYIYIYILVFVCLYTFLKNFYVYIILISVCIHFVIMYSRSCLFHKLKYKYIVAKFSKKYTLVTIDLHNFALY